jgi:hypothetical protein
MLILLVVCLLITIAYNSYIFIRFKKVPQSLSETSYLFGGNKRYFFTAYCMIVCLLLLPLLLEITPNNFQIIPFIFCGGLSFAGCSPLFRKGLDKKIHYISAYIAFGAFILYMVLCMHWIYIIVYAVLFGVLCLWKYKCYVYFAEMLALLFLIFFSFYTMFI